MAIKFFVDGGTVSEQDMRDIENLTDQYLSWRPIGFQTAGFPIGAMSVAPEAQLLTMAGMELADDLGVAGFATDMRPSWSTYVEPSRLSGTGRRLMLRWHVWVSSDFTGWGTMHVAMWRAGWAEHETSGTMDQSAYMRPMYVTNSVRVSDFAFAPPPVDTEYHYISPSFVSPPDGGYVYGAYTEPPVTAGGQAISIGAYLEEAIV